MTEFSDHTLELLKRAKAVCAEAHEALGTEHSRYSVYLALTDLLRTLNEAGIHVPGSDGEY